jgi:hypothetical protein
VISWFSKFALKCNLYRYNPVPRWDGKHHMGSNAVACTCFDGYVGDFCEERVRQFCLNDCGYNGECEHGHCRCRAGYFGADCSQLAGGGLAPVGIGSGVGAGAQSAEAAAAEAGADGGSRTRHVTRSGENGLQTGQTETGSGSVASGDRPPRRRHARRPLVYVYDLDPRYTTAQLQQRQERRKCTTRVMDKNNETLFVDNLYGVETALHEMLLDSPHRTEDPELADFFFVPLYQFCFLSRIQQPVPDHSHLRYQTELGPSCGDITHVDATIAKLFTPLMRHVMNDFPFWNRSGGADHLIPFLHDEGACYAPKEVGLYKLISVDRPIA